VIDPYEETKDLIAHMAAVKMRMNSHKALIEENSSEWLMQKLREEIEEFQQAIDGEGYMNILEEAADIHNYVMAIVHQQVHKYRNRK
jgi:NTP pyrophosphatase (non-canonical NTP hydrolase)